MIESAAKLYAMTKMTLEKLTKDVFCEGAFISYVI